MKIFTLTVMVLTAMQIVCFAQSQAQDTIPQKHGALLISPIKKSMGYRTNFHKKNFWDFKLSYDLLVTPAGGVVSINPEITWKHRTFQTAFSRFYWGVGLQSDYFVPTFIVPFGIEIFPARHIENFSISVEAGPQAFFMVSYGLRGWADISVLWYFNKKKKNE